MRFTTRDYIRRQCDWLDMQELLKKPLPVYVYYSRQLFGEQR